MIKNPENDNEPDEGFLSRWSKRKQSVKTKSPNENDDVEENKEVISLNTIADSDTTGRMLTTVEADLAQDQEVEDQPPAKLLTDEDMPAVEELGEHSDYSGFMSSGVSDKLRKVALRKLFAGAGFNIRDGLDDYDEDFTNFPALGDIVTCDMKHQMELAEERKRQAEELAEKERIALLEEQQDENTKVMETLDKDPDKEIEQESTDETTGEAKLVAHEKEVQDEQPEKYQDSQQLNPNSPIQKS